VRADNRKNAREVTPEPPLLERMTLRALAAWRPPPKLTLSEWADEHARLSEESSAEGGKWHTLPYQRGIMDAITDPETVEVWLIKSARVGWTKICNHTIGYHLHQDPCPILLVQPTLDDAEGYSKEEIAPMLRDTPALSDLTYSESKSKDSNNTLLHKIFKGGGVLSLAGANSPRGFRRISRRVVIFDEVDGYPPSAGAEGDQLKLGIKRTEYYWNRKILGGSTPTIRDLSRIEQKFKDGTQERFYVACPHCDHPQVLEWGGKDTPHGIKWPDGEPERAHYVCAGGGCIIQHDEKFAMMEDAERRQAAGESGIGWVAHAPFRNGRRSFHINALYSYSPNAGWGLIAQEFLEAKDNPETLKTFVNTVLGETWEENYSAKLRGESLEERAEDYPLLTVPRGGLLLTGAVDVQDNRIEVAVWAYGEQEESWLVNYAQLFGDPETRELWEQVDSVIDMPYRHQDGADMRVRAVCADTGGHHTHATYVWVNNRARRRKRDQHLPHVVAIKGSSLPGRPAISGKSTKQDIHHRGQVIVKGADLFMVGTDTIKTVVYRRLMRDGADGKPVAMHWPKGLPVDFFRQLTAERQLTKYSKTGFTVRVWVKKAGERNEALDLTVYSYAALQWFYSRVNRATLWTQLKKLVTPPANADPRPAEPEKAPVSVVPRKQVLRRPRRGWIGGWRK
jgi:phage terminase large subunit GpA-like protein